MKNIITVLVFFGFVGLVATYKYGLPAPYDKAEQQADTGKPLFTVEELKTVIRQETGAAVSKEELEALQ